MEGLAKPPGVDVEEGGIGDQIPLDIGHMGVFDSHLAKAIGSCGKMLGTGRAGVVIRALGQDVTLPAARE